MGINADAGTPWIPILGGPLPAVNSTMWSGTAFFPNAAAPYVPKGTLVLTFVDRKTKQVVWHGMVSEKFDVEKKNKAVQQVDKAIIKLLEEFPPRKP